MLNGKFFVGLPATMMDHASGPNRQQTNFFWPDESKMEAVVDTRSRLRYKNQFERTPEKTIEIEVNPNELHKQQLSSKINLDENLPKPKFNVPAKPSNLKRRDTFSSKIQFYDFDNETTPQQPKTNKNSNVEVEKNLNNSTKTNDKRISFIDNKTQHKGGMNIGIMKNNQTETKLTPSSLPKKPTMKNLSKSKSMTDISAENNIKVIENDVKNISISKPTYQVFNDSDEYVVSPRRQVRTPMRSTTLFRRSRPITEYYEDNEDDHFYAERKQLLAHPKSLHYNKTYRSFERQPGFQENYILAKDNRDKIHDSRQSYTTRAERRYANRGRHFEDDYEYQFESRGSELPRRLFPKETRSIKVNLDADHYDNRGTTRDSQEKFGINPHAGDHRIDEGQKPNNLKRNSRNQTATPAPISRAHRHLVSNVAFWSDTETTNNSNHNQRTIRNSAVARVSVGLPDT